MQDKQKIDLETGLVIDVVHPSETGLDIIEVPLTSPMYQPKWTGTALEDEEGNQYMGEGEWIETGQAPEPTPQQPTESELLMLAVAELADIVMGG